MTALTNNVFNIATHASLVWQLSTALLALFLVLAIGIFECRRRMMIETIYRLNQQMRHHWPYRPAPAATAANKITSNGDDDVTVALYRKIDHMLDEDELCLDPMLTLPRLATLVGSNQKYVSQAISLHGPGNFNVLLNSYRIKWAKVLLAQADEVPNISRLAEQCGFRSRSSFYDAFQKSVSLTPRQYHQEAANRRPQS